MPDGDAFIAYMGLSDHPRADELVEEIDAAIADAAFARLTELAQADPLIRAMTNPGYQLWERTRFALKDLRPGLRVEPPSLPLYDRGLTNWPKASGWVLREVGESWVRIEGVDHKEEPIRDCSRSLDVTQIERDGLIVILPIPLDATTLAAQPYQGER